jgi:hypothetical protein
VPISPGGRAEWRPDNLLEAGTIHQPAPFTQDEADAYLDALEEGNEIPTDLIAHVHSLADELAPAPDLRPCHVRGGLQRKHHPAHAR